MRAGPPASRGRRRFTSRKCPRWFVPNCVSNPSAVRPSGVAMTPALAMITSRRVVRGVDAVGERADGCEGREIHLAQLDGRTGGRGRRAHRLGRALALGDVADAEDHVPAVGGDRARGFLAQPGRRARHQHPLAGQVDAVQHFVAGRLASKGHDAQPRAQDQGVLDLVPGAFSRRGRPGARPRRLRRGCRRRAWRGCSRRARSRSSR